MTQSDMKRPWSRRTVIAAVAGVIAGILAYSVWDFRFLTAIVIAAVVFLLLWLLWGIFGGDDDAVVSIAEPARSPAPTPTPPPNPLRAANAVPTPPAPLAEAAAPAASVMSAPVAETAPAPAKKPRVTKPKTAPAAKAAAAAPAAKAKAAAKPKAAKAPKAAKPAGLVRLTAPRKGKADDLKEIEGIGPALEKLCNSLGFYHFDQIASWSDADVALVDAEMKTFKGRIARDKWVAQAKIIITDGLEAFRIRAKTNDY